MKARKEQEAKEAAANINNKNQKVNKDNFRIVKDLDTVDALEKMLDDPEDSVSDIDQQNDDLIKLRMGGPGGKDKYQRFRKNLFKPQIPSLLELCCNSVEAMRLRHNLVEAYHQRGALITVYSSQL